MSNVNIIKPPKRLSGDTEAVVRHIYDQINILSNATNRASTGEARDRTGGKSGDIQLVHDKASGQYGIEGRFEEGWMRFGLGEGVLVQSNQRQPFIPPSNRDDTNLTRTIQDMFPSVARLRLDVNPGSVTSLPIFAIGEDGILKDGDIITVTSLNGYVVNFVISADVSGAATSISVEKKIVGRKLLAGSNIYLSQKSLGTWISQLENSITIGAGINDFDIITRINGAQSGTVTSLTVDAIPISLKEDWVLLVTDLDTGNVYQCIVSAGSVGIGATWIPIDSIAIDVADNSPVRLSQLSLLSYINISAEGVLIEANALRGAVFLGETGTAESTTGTTVNVAAPGIRIPVKDNDIVYIVDSGDLTNINTVVVNGNYDSGGSFFIDSVLRDWGFGSEIYLSGASFTSSLDVKFDEIALSVKKDVFRDYLNGTLIGKVNSPGSSFTLDSPGLAIEVYAGDVLRFVHNEEAGQTLSGNPTIYRTITKAVDPEGPYAIGATSLTGTGSGTMYTDMLVYMETAGPYRIGSSMQLFIDSIVVDTPVLRSGNYSPGVDGWAINGDGSAEFNDMILRGELVLDYIGAGKTAGDPPVGEIRFKSLADSTGNYEYVSMHNLFSGVLPMEFRIESLNDGLLGPGGVTGGHFMTVTGFDFVSFRDWSNNPVPVYGRHYLEFGVPYGVVFSGSTVPGTVGGSIVGDFYRRTGTEELYIKTANPSTWLKIGPTSLPPILSYSFGPVGGNPSEIGRLDGDFHYDTDTATLFLKNDTLFSPFIEIARSYEQSSESRSVLIYRGNFASDPGSPTRGDVYYNTGSSQLRFYTGSTWTAI